MKRGKLQSSLQFHPTFPDGLPARQAVSLAILMPTQPRQRHEELPRGPVRSGHLVPPPTQQQHPLPRQEVARWPLLQIPHEASETARKYRFADGAPGEIGLIAPVTQPFCGHCSRIRLTADGKLRTCLFSKEDHDLRSLLRENVADEDLAIYIRSVVNEKEKGHRINEPGFVPPSRTMVFIGG